MKINYLQARYLMPVFLDPKIIDASILWIRFGNLTKRFNTYEEKEAWEKKARKLNKEFYRKKGYSCLIVPYSKFKGNIGDIR